MIYNFQVKVIYRESEITTTIQALSWDSDTDCVESVDEFWEFCHLDSIEFSGP